MANSYHKAYIFEYTTRVRVENAMYERVAELPGINQTDNLEPTEARYKFQYRELRGPTRVG